MNKLSFIAYAIILVFMGCGEDAGSTGGSEGSSNGSKSSDSNTVNTDKSAGSSNVITEKPSSETKTSDTTVNQPSKSESTYSGGYSVKKISFSDGLEQSFSYNEQGKIIKIVGEPEFSSTDTYQYNTSGQLVKKGNREYTYNEKGQLLTITITPSGGVTNFSYNGERQLIKKVVGSFSTTYAYNNLGQLREQNDGGVQTTYTYDTLGKLKSAKYSDNGNETIYSYGSKGEILTSVTSGKTTTYSYDYKSCTTDFKVLFIGLPSQLTSAMCRK